MSEPRRSVRIYRDTLGVLRAENLAEMDKAGITEHKPEWNIISEQAVNMGFTEFYMLFDGIEDEEVKRLVAEVSGIGAMLKGQQLGTSIPELLVALSQEGTQANLQDNEEYYALVFSIHPSQLKYRSRIADEIQKAVEANNGWMNPIVLNDASPTSFRYDLSISKPVETKETIAKLMKRYAVSKWDFRKNDF
jgi:hypothetical protein